MAFIVFSCRTPEGDYKECVYGDPNLERCFDALTLLVQANWQLVDAKLSTDCGANLIWLPVEAFDGEPITGPLKALQKEWEEVLQGC